MLDCGHALAYLVNAAVGIEPRAECARQGLPTELRLQLGIRLLKSSSLFSTQDSQMWFLTVYDQMLHRVNYLISTRSGKLP